MYFDRPVAILSCDAMSGVTADIRSFIETKPDAERFSFIPVEWVEFGEDQQSKEYKPRITKPIRGYDVYIIFSLFYPDHHTAIFKLLLLIEAASSAEANSINLVAPYVPYERQDTKDEPRVPISARLILRLLGLDNKVSSIISLDPHFPQIQGFFAPKPFHSLYGGLVRGRYFRELYKESLDRVVAVAPDQGRKKATKKQFAPYIRNNPKIPLICLDKDRIGSGITVEEDVEKFFKGIPKDWIILIDDDMAGSGETNVETVKLVRNIGYNNVFGTVTHGIFSKKKGIRAEDRFRNAGVKLICTDTIPRSPEYLRENADWLTMLKTGPILARAIYESSKIGGSISSIFEI